MQPTERDLRKRYESLETDELIDLYRNGQLTALASSVLKDVLDSRGFGSEQFDDLVTEDCSKVNETASRLASAEKAIRRGAVAGFIVAGLSLVLVSIAIGVQAKGILEAWNDPWNYLDVAILVGLSFGTLRRSRVSATCLLVYFFSAQIIQFIDAGRISGILWLLLFLFFFGHAVRGTFVYHRIHKEQDPEYRPVRRAMYFVWVPVGIICVLLAGLALVGGYEMLNRERGDHLEPGKSVSGASGLYILDPPGSGWVRVSSGTIGEETDLELYGSTVETSVVVFVDCRTNLPLDYVVEYRRNAIQTEFSGFSVSEERLMMPESFFPVSYARYSGEIPITGENQIWWVATVVTDDAVIELVASTTLSLSEEAGIERLVKSLRLAGKGGKPCGAS